MFGRQHHEEFCAHRYAVSGECTAYSAAGKVLLKRDKLKKSCQTICTLTLALDLASSKLAGHFAVQSGKQAIAHLRVNEFILFLVLLAIPLEVLHDLGLLVAIEQSVGPMSPAELKEAFPL